MSGSGKPWVEAQCGLNPPQPLPHSGVFEVWWYFCFHPFPWKSEASELTFKLFSWKLWMSGCSWTACITGSVGKDLFLLQEGTCCTAGAEVTAHTGCAFSVMLGTLRHWGGWRHLSLCCWFYQGIWFQAFKCERIILLQFCCSAALLFLTKSYLPLPFFLQSLFTGRQPTSSRVYDARCCEPQHATTASHIFQLQHVLTSRGPANVPAEWVAASPLSFPPS